MWFFFGLLSGLVLSIPMIFFTARRVGRRVRKLEQRAQTAERLAELGTMTGGLAHEIKNPLSTIGLNLQLLRESITELQLSDSTQPRLLNRLDAVTAETDRLKGILEDFLSFAGRLKLDPRSVDLNQLIEQVSDFYYPQAEASGVRLVLQLDPACGSIQLDATLMKQALLNLLINATQAMVEARYSNQPHGGAEQLFLRTEVTKEYALLHVIDTGPGIDAPTQQKLFHPYFSTKKGGTGLGLPTTRRIVEEHGGSMNVQSELGRGSDFIIRLPLPDAR